MLIRCFNIVNLKEKKDVQAPFFFSSVEVYIIFL